MGHNLHVAGLRERAGGHKHQSDKRGRKGTKWRWWDGTLKEVKREGIGETENGREKE